MQILETYLIGRFVSLQTDIFPKKNSNWNLLSAFFIWEANYIRIYLFQNDRANNMTRPTACFRLDTLFLLSRQPRCCCLRYFLLLLFCSNLRASFRAFKTPPRVFSGFGNLVLPGCSTSLFLLWVWASWEWQGDRRIPFFSFFSFVTACGLEGDENIALNRWGGL